ncbi:MAG: helix-turn-helix domain-containing protein, partial [Herbaspirillum sp.]
VAFADNGVIDVNDLVFRSAASVLTQVVVPELMPASGMHLPTTDTVLRTSTLSECADASESALQEVRVVVLDEFELPESLPAHLDQVEREIICRALAKTRFNRTQAAQLLGISFRQLRYRMQRLVIHERE